jgi:hypothetical protein
MTITGLGASQLRISGQKAGAVFSIASLATVSLAGLTIADGQASQGGGIQNDGLLTVSDCTLTGNVSPDDGGAIDNFGRLWVTDCTLHDNSAHHGGGIANSGQMTVTGSTFYLNSAAAGGGIYGYNATTSQVSNSTSATAPSIGTQPPTRAAVFISTTRS